MKIGIVTVYKSENCGSFLQAWALKSILEKMGCSVCFVPYKSSNENILKISWQIIKSCIKFKYKTAYYLIKRKIEFNKARRNFAILNNNDKVDIFIFGSDTIWNFEKPFFYKNKLFFTGKGITQPRYTYAVSSGSTPCDYFENDIELIEQIARFDRISVRDDYIKQTLERLFPDKHILRVLDPTLLLDTSDYLNISSQPPAFRDYIFIYYFGTISNKLFDALFLFARKQKLKLIKMGSPDRRFDVNLINSPKEFIRYFSNAKFIFTNTFHGCVFSVLFNKQFITDGLNKKKVQDFIDRYNLHSQFLTEVNATTIEAKFKNLINYQDINEEINKDRNISLRFLTEILNRGFAE